MRNILVPIAALIVYHYWFGEKLCDEKRYGTYAITGGATVLIVCKIVDRYKL